MEVRLRYLLCVMCLLLAGVTAGAQVTGSSIRGRVTDGTGAPVSGVAVTALHLPTGTLYETESNAEGCFSLRGMRVGGPYQVEVFLLGMAAVVYEDQSLTAGEVQEFFPVLRPVMELQTVVVNGEASSPVGVDGTGSVFSRERIAAVPTEGSFLQDVVSLSPQALASPLGLSILGSNVLYNAFHIDGAPAALPFCLDGVNPIPLDFVETIRVTAAPFDVRQSGFTGGAVDVITQSGTNRINASAYSRILAPGMSGEETGLSRQAYGFTVGAPVIRDRLFLFAAGEYALGSVAGLKDHTAHFNARADWNINAVHRLMSRIQFLDSQAGRAGTWVSELQSRLSDRLSNEVRATAFFAGKGALEASLTDNLTLISGHHQLTAGTRDGVYGPVAELSLYAQDEWSPGERFSLSLGVRAEAALLTGKSGGRIRPSVSPRLGFRFFMDSDRKSLLRGGAGLFTGRIPAAWLTCPADGTLLLPQSLRAGLGFDQQLGRGWKLSIDALASKVVNELFFVDKGLAGDGVVYGVNAEAAKFSTKKSAPFYRPSSGENDIVLSRTGKGYAYSVSAKLEKQFDWGLDLAASYALTRSFSVFDGIAAAAAENWSTHLAMDPVSPSELSQSRFDRPHHLSVLASYVSPEYGICRTRISLVLSGRSGARYSFATDLAGEDYNGDGCPGNTLIYIPGESELVSMRWTDAASAARFENFIRGDEYLGSHRGEWSRRFPAAYPFETRLDLRFVQEFYYNRRFGRRVQLTADLINAGDVFVPGSGVRYLADPARRILRIDALEPDGAGGKVPTYSFCGADGFEKDPVLSGWRCVFGVKLLF